MSIPYFRPSRRDIVLCLLTLSFSYILFHDSSASASPSHHSSNGGGYGDGGSGSSLGKWRVEDDDFPSHGSSGDGSGLSSPGNAPSRWSFWPSSSSSSGSSQSEQAHGAGGGGLRRGGETTFWDSVRTYGTTPPQGHTANDEDQFEYSGPLGKLGKESWKGDKSLLMTKLVGHQPGWTLMERVYIYNGSLYVVTENRNEWPDLVRMTSTGKEANGEPGNSQERYPKGHEIMFISPAEAARLWGPRVEMMGGMTWMINDGQFVDHYYHFAAELLMGLWRATAALYPDIGPRGETNFIPPQRAWFLHQDVTQWRDKPRFNPTILFALFPSISMLYPQDWADMTNTTTIASHAPRAFVMERCLLTDRSASFYGEWTAPTSRTVASALMLGETSRWWWEPVRRHILRYSGVAEDVLDRNLEGVGAVDPMHYAEGDMATPRHAQPIGKHPGVVEPIVKVEAEQRDRKYKDVVTYISRQGSRRHLSKESHDELVSHLERKRDEMGFELVVVEAEKLSIEEQFALAGRTTIMLGVHGNGLTHLIWMPATPRSAVIEMYIRGGFARDYQWTAHALGMRHFGINHDVIYTIPDLPEVAYPEGFHGTEITVDGKTVADLIERRLKGLV